jgi:ketosteroid isomerase-like protein
MAMSQEIEDFVRSAYDRFNAGERLPSADAWHADGVYVNSSNDPDPDTHRGIDAIVKQFQMWIDAYPDLRVDPLEILVNGDRALVWARWSGHGAGSEVPIEMVMAQVWTIEDGRIRRIEEYMDRAEALEAAGMAE